MGKYHKIEQMLDEELDKISAQGKLGTSALEVGDKVAHFLKSIKTIEAMDEGSSYGDYSDRSYAYDGMSYARGRGRNAKRDSIGRYSSEMGNKQEMMTELEEMKRRIENMED